MEARLHGPAATDAIQLYARLGAAGARFDGRRVAKAVLTARGRLRVSSALRAALSRAPRILLTASRPRERRAPAPSGTRKLAASGDAKPRPRPAAGEPGWIYVGSYPDDPGTTPESPPFLNDWGNWEPDGS